MTQIPLDTTVEPVSVTTASHFLSHETAARYLWALTRLCLGWTFLWSFLDKLFGLRSVSVSFDTVVTVTEDSIMATYLT